MKRGCSNKTSGILDHQLQLESELKDTKILVVGPPGSGINIDKVCAKQLFDQKVFTKSSTTAYLSYSSYFLRSSCRAPFAYNCVSNY